MSTLQVFDSRGRALYPETAGNDSAMRSYFDDQVFAMDIADGSAIIEVYLRIKTDKQREQVSLRFQGDDPQTVFSDCRKAVQQELVTQRGWEIMEPYGTGPEEVFWHAIWENESDTGNDMSPETFLTDETYGLGLDKFEAEILQSFPLEDKTKTARILASDYKRIAKALGLFQGASYTVTVSRPRRSPSSHSEIHFSPAQDQLSKFELHDETIGIIDERKQQRRTERRAEKFGDLQSILQELSELNAGQQQVNDHLSNALNNTYSGLSIVPDKELKQLQQKALASSESETQPLNTGRTGLNLRVSPFSSWKKRMLVLIPAILIITVGALILFTSLSLPFLGSSGSGAHSAHFSIFVDEVDTEVTDGEQFTASVNVSNTGDVSGSQTIALVVNNTTVDQANVTLSPDEKQLVELSMPIADRQPGDYDYIIRSNDEQISGTVTVTN